MFLSVFRRSLHLSSKLLYKTVTINGLEYQIISPGRYKEALVHLRKTFYTDEPLSKAVNLAPDNEELAGYILETLGNGLSLMALDKEDKMAGVLLNGLFRKGDEEKYDEKIAELKTDFKKIVRLLCDVNVPIDLFGKFNVDLLFETRIVAVQPKYRGKRIGFELIHQAELLAKERGLKAIKTEATGKFSQAINKALGFQTIHEIFYDQYLGKDGKPVFNIEPLHKSVQLMYKVIK